MTRFFLAMIALNLFAPFAKAQTETRTYRSYLLELRTLAGETKSAELQVTPKVDTVRNGDPEIPGHGHYDYSVTGTVVEAGNSCRFVLPLSTGKGEEQTSVQILESGVDRSGLVNLCSGLTLELSSVRGLLTSDTLNLNLRANGLTQAIGKGTAVFQGIRTVEEPACADPWHCPPHFIGPRR
jgi:hypothetical protein